MNKSEKLLRAINEVLKGKEAPKKDESETPSKDKKGKKGKKLPPWMKK